MPVVQITTGMALIRAALATALAPLVGTYQGAAKAYWLQAPEQAPLPLLIYQPQSPPQDTSPLNGAAVSGLFTIKALAATNAAAETLIATVPAAMLGLSVSGYRALVLFDRELSLPPRDEVFVAGLIYQIDLYL